MIKDGSVIVWCQRRVRGVAGMHYAHHPSKKPVLFSIPDRPAHEALGIWQEDRKG